jgi:hypothetical protein
VIRERGAAITRDEKRAHHLSTVSDALAEIADLIQELAGAAEGLEELAFVEDAEDTRELAATLRRVLR